MSADIIPFPELVAPTIADYRAEPAIVLIMPVVAIEGRAHRMRREAFEMAKDPMNFDLFSSWPTPRKD